MPLRPQLRMRIKLALSVLAAALVAPEARADRRTLIRAYEYMTQPKGNLELEIWNEVEAPKDGGFDQAATVHRIELEYGLTDQWDVALYHVFAQEPAAAFRFDSWRLETRYRLFEKNVLPVDIELYLEVERPATFTEPWEVEEKVILEKEFGAFALVANLVAEQKLRSGAGHAWEIDVGARYEVVPQLRLGAEFWTIQGDNLRRERGQLLRRSLRLLGLEQDLAAARRRVRRRRFSGATFVRSVLGINL